jgi:hypothetical protein
MPPRARDGLWLGLNAGLGIAFGGDDVPDRSAGIPAGDGIVLSLGATLTPLWLGPVGLGAGVDLGFKYYALQTRGGGYDLRRVPIVASLHALVSVADRWFLLFAGGLHAEVAIQASRTGSRSDGSETRYPAAFGAMGEAGVLYAVGHVGVDITLRFAGLRYEAEPPADASHVGLFFGVHYLF